MVVSDTAGRAWRHGQTDIAIGCAGLLPLDPFAGHDDSYGNPLLVTAPAVADKVAFAIKAKQDTAITIVDLPTTKVVLRKMNAQSQKLIGACFAIYKATSAGRGKLVYDETCDREDGKERPEVGGVPDGRHQ